jgi:hypothetical protein
MLGLFSLDWQKSAAKFTNIRIQMSLVKEIYFPNEEFMVRGYPKFYIPLSKNLTPLTLVS